MAQRLTFEDLVPDISKNRFAQVKRSYSPQDVLRLRGNFLSESYIARKGSEKLWKLLNDNDFIRALGAMTGFQAVQQVRAGLKAIYLSGWQVAADANLAGMTYPDQSLYPSDSGPALCRRINKALIRADQVDLKDENSQTDWLTPIIADAEAGFGGPLNCYEIMQAYIESGAAAVHFEDQLTSEKKCGHLGGKVLIPTCAHERVLTAARLAADVLGVSTILIARTDAESASFITSDIDERDCPFIDKTRSRTSEGFYPLKEGTGLENAVHRALSYAPYADLLWCETSTPDLKQARYFAESIKKVYPNTMLAYNCSPSFNWRQHLDEQTIRNFQNELGSMGYKFQFITLAGFHSLNYSMFNLSEEYSRTGMEAYSNLQVSEFSAENKGYTATRHQQEVGVGYFDLVNDIISNGQTSTSALSNSTESVQFIPETHLSSNQKHI